MSEEERYVSDIKKTNNKIAFVINLFLAIRKINLNIFSKDFFKKLLFYHSLKECCIQKYLQQVFYENWCKYKVSERHFNLL